MQLKSKVEQLETWMWWQKSETNICAKKITFGISVLVLVKMVNI